MAATIQNIELPKKPRARDTSSSIQEISQELITEGDFATHATWTANTGWDDTGGFGAWDTSAESSNRVYQTIDALVVGEVYKLTFTISESTNGRQLVRLDGTGPTQDVTITAAGALGYGTYADGTHTIYFTALYASTVFNVFGHYNFSGFNIDDISLKRVDTFSNNNHGKIYSGRALEFDGVTDYLSVGSDVTVSTGAWTVAAWVNISTLPGEGDVQDNVSSTSSAVSSRFIGVRATGTAAIWDYNSGWRETSTALNLNTWYRVLWVYDGANEVTIYLNGVADGTGVLSSSSSYDHLKVQYIGAIYGSPTIRHWDGKLSDYQAWDKAFTAADAAYDYANPESLALNASGTSLTESNLKLWYPMQDGHRGQQSYILDGANTGYVNRLTDRDGDYYGDMEGLTVASGHIDNASGYRVWSKYNNSTLSLDNTIKYSGSSALKIECNSGDSFSGLYSAYNSNDDKLSTVAGQTYRISGYIYRQSGSDTITLHVKKGLDGGNWGLTGSAVTPTSNGVWEFFEVYYIAPTTGDLAYLLFSSSYSDNVYNLDNVEWGPINDKHHATTVFLGDELITDTNDRTFAGTNNWANGGGSNAFHSYNENYTGAGYSGGALQLVSDNDASNVQFAILDGAAGNGWETDMVEGRTYRLSFQALIARTSGTLSVGFANASHALSSDIKAFTGTAGVDTVYTLDFVYNATNHAELIVHVAVSSVWIAILDDISIKEIGAATGWTDADQQLDIAQTALQSYNEMLWCTASQDAGNTIVTVADNSNLDVDDEDFSISCWIYPVTESDYLPIFRKGGAGAEGYALVVNTSNKISLNLNDGSDDNGYDNLTDAVVPSGQWSHVVVTCDRDSATGIRCYLNGVLQSANDDPTGQNEDISNSTVVQMLAFSETDNDSFSGTATEFMLFKDCLLSSSQVHELYNDGKALNGTTHSLFSTKCTAYYRNNGLSSWVNLATVADSGATSTAAAAATVTNGAETILIPQGVDGSRDAQGFIMNKKRSTSSLNFPVDKSSLTPNLDTGSYVEVDDHSGLTFGTGNFSMECWVKPSYRSKGSSSLNTIFTLGGQINDSDSAGLCTSSTSILAYIGGVDMSKEYSSNNWHHVVATREGLGSGEMKLYINGVEEATGTSVDDVDTSTNINNAHNMTIGAEDNRTRGYEEAVDSIKVYNIALDSTEVTKNYKATKGSH